MAFSDWIFFQRTTGVGSDIQIEGESLSPLAGARSLLIHDLGQPAAATVAMIPNPLAFATRIEAGIIQTTFKRRDGNGFLDYGVFFLSQGTDPTRDNVEVYVVYFTSGGTTLRLMKYNNGLHDISGALLDTYTPSTTTQTEPCVLSVRWEAGILRRYRTYLTVNVGYGDNTTDFGDQEFFSTTTEMTSTPVTGIGAGVFVRSRHSSEPLYALIDQTNIYQTNIV